MDHTIVSYCTIQDNLVHKNGELYFQGDSRDFNQFSELLYKFTGISYPKFHKMDNLCKLGLLASDILLKSNDLLNNTAPEKTGVILSNKSSSLDTDLRYNRMVRSGIPSPAVFVYSLPNIVIGEICIRNGIKGENTFFISATYEIQSQVNYINQLFENDVLDVCIGGWLELLENSYKAFLYLAIKDEPEPGKLVHTEETIKILYHKV